MAVKTPDWWKEEEMIEAETAYGNKVMIPRRMSQGWEMQHIVKDYCEKHDLDPLNGLEKKEKINPTAYDMVRTFWEIYED